MKHPDQVFIAAKRLRIALERVQTAPSTAERDRAAKWARAWNRAIQRLIEQQRRAAGEKNARLAEGAGDKYSMRR